MLERNLGVRLFQRSTRKLTLTEAGERFLHAIEGNLSDLQVAIASVGTDRGEPAGVLKVSMGLSFGVDYIVPMLPAFLRRYPNIRPDWQFETRQVDLITEGFDAAIGGGIELAPGVVSRPLAPRCPWLVDGDLVMSNDEDPQAASNSMMNLYRRSHPDKE
jgi:DNA-binding transcriptional LysR family regulator